MGGYQVSSPVALARVAGAFYLLEIVIGGFPRKWAWRESARTVSAQILVFPRVCDTAVRR